MNGEVNRRSVFGDLPSSVKGSRITTKQIGVC